MAELTPEEKQKAKFERKKQKLLDKNARLRGKKDKQNSDLSGNTSIFDSSDESLADWYNLVDLLSTKDITLRPQILFEYFAIVIQSFAGSNICVSISRNAFTLNNNKYDLNDKKTISQIHTILPIVSGEQWNFSDSKSNDINESKQTENAFKSSKWIKENENKFAMITRRDGNRNNDTSTLYPHFLNEKYEWTSTANMYCKMIPHDIEGFRDGVIINNNIYGQICIFSAKNGIYYSDPLKSNHSQRILGFKKEFENYFSAIPPLDCRVLWAQTDGNVFGLAFGSEFYTVYAMRLVNDIHMNAQEKKRNRNKVANKNLCNYVVHELENTQSQHLLYTNTASNNDLTAIFGAYFDNKNMYGDAALYIVGEQYIYRHGMSRMDRAHFWNIVFVFKNIKENVSKQYLKEFRSFIGENECLLEEQCLIAFVDDREIGNKQMVLIFKKYVLRFALIGNWKEKEENIKKVKEFGKVYKLKNVIPEMSRMSNFSTNAMKMIYSYEQRALVVFEKLSGSSSYTFRFSRILLSSFHF